MTNENAIIYSDDFLLHKAPFGHPENEQRLISVINKLETLNYLGFDLVEPQEASIDDLSLVHSKQNIEIIKNAITDGIDIDPDTYTSEQSYIAATRSAGSLLTAFDLINKDYKSVFCLNRPPGHHATPNKAMGFCLFNNIAVGAARYTNNNEKKVVILDFDAHHGNGTQEIFYENNNVLYCSWHQSPHYPGTGSLDEVGANKGEGYNINIELESGSGDIVFLSTLQLVVMPIIKQFKPDLILVSAGFDSHASDPLSSLMFSENGYADFYKYILNYCQNRSIGLISCLEGGYDLNSLSINILKCLRVLTDINYEVKIDSKKFEKTEFIYKLIHKFKHYWDISDET